MNIDLDIIDKCKREDRKAQFELFHSCFGFIMSICLRYYNNEEDAKSVANLVFYKVLSKIGTYQSSNSFEGWLRRITANTIIDEYRKNMKFKFHIDFKEELVEEPAHTISNFESEVDIEVLRMMINRLPQNQKIAFNMIVIDGYSYQEFADLNDFNIGTTKWLIHKARKTLQAEISNHYKLKDRHYVK